MGEIVIKKKNTTIDLFNYKPFRSVTKAELSRTLMSDDYVDISVECANPLDLSLGDRVTVEGRTFFLNMLPPAKKLAEDQFSYELRFEGPAFLLRKLKVFNLDSQGNKTTNEFPLTGEINEFLYLLINNANKKDNQWILGNFPSNTETKTLTFNNENCLAVLQRICQEFNVEFDIVEAGGKFTLNIREKIGKTLPFTVEYGMGNGLYDLSRARANDSEVVTVLYAYGSSQNIPVDYRGYSPRLRMPVAVGDYISNQAAIDLFGYVEDVFTPDIKPTFKGKVSGVRSLANGVQEISVSNMDFDLKEKKADRSTKYLIAGTPAKISVTKGDLAGYDFEVVDYIHSTKTFKLKQFADERGQKFPDNTTVFKFAAGDEFTLIDIMMPDQYITNAEQKLYDETVKEYQKVSQNNVKYTLNVDPLFLQDKGEIGIGDLLPIKDADFGIDKASRIISLKKDLLTDTYTSFDVADSYEISLVKEIVNNIKDLQKEIASQKVINRQSYLDGYRRVEDRFSMYFDADGKMDGSHIKADKIDVGMLSSGSKSRWFQLEEVVFTPNLGSDPNSFRATAGRLVHFGIKTSSGAERVWNLSALTVSNLLNQGYYVYAKCDINGDYGTFVITPDRIVFDSQPNYYHFLIGNLYSPSNGFRIFDANYGVSQVNGRQITAGEIASVNRRLIIDLDKGEIIGKVTFTNDSPALGQVQVNIDQSKTESIAAAKAYSDAQDNLKEITTKAYADGIVDAEESRAIADATAKMEAAKLHAQVLVNDIEIGGCNLILQSKRIPVEMGGGTSLQLEAGGFQLTNSTEYCKWNTSNVQQGLLTMSFKIKRIEGSGDGRNIRFYNGTGYEEIPNTSNITTETIVTYSFRNSGNIQGLYMTFLTGRIEISWLQLESGNKATDWTPAPEDVESSILKSKTDSVTASKAYSDAQDALKETIIKAYSDEKISEAENRSIIDATNKADAAKTYATAQDNLLKIQLEAYADGQIDIEEAARIQQAQNNLAAAKAYSDAQDNLAKIAANAYADGVVDAEEARAIADATAKMETAKNHAQTLVNNVQVGGRNLILQSKKTPVEMGGGASLQLEAGGFQLTNATEYCKWNTSNVQQGLLILSFKIKRLEGQGDGRNIRFYNGTGYEEIPNTSNITTETIVTHQFTNSGNFEKLYMTFLTGRIEISWLQLESGNKSTDWTPAPEDVDNKIKQNEQQTALAKAQADNALATSNITSQKVSFLSTTINNNVIATGTLEVGDVVGANAGISGVTDRGRQSVRLYAGSAYAGKNTAPWYIDDYGVEYQFLNGVMIRRRGVINGNYIDELYNTSGILAKRTGIINGRITEEWYNNGLLVYQIGQNGIYFVSEISESFMLYRLVDLSSNSATSDFTYFHDRIRNNMWQYTNNPTRFELIGNKDSYLYDAGRNIYSEGNKQYNGYKNSKNMFDNIPDGWYCIEQLGNMDTDGIDPTKKIVNIMRVSEGKPAQAGYTAVDTTGFIFQQK
ncbi:phage tail protein [Elizabethkingia bruuniana]|uniref:Phage tail protein n=1 Tax=Elizabethkingia bruuniana TaxID=1756149 RepID=A0A7T7UWK5_9FLAO|nr:phage tail protein [Elizabethkingia bruuniana]QDZ63216.1 hypothetical protein EVD20_12035 [Elizabethkingia bruuniana]QQN57544.1 phage tail protein [Elizabethkingia bruuniana]